MQHNLYIHIPFCASKCNYCAFYSHACAAPNWDAWCDGILIEINYWADRLGKITVPTIFFGGGTPSLMPTEIFDQIMKTIRERFLLTDNCEITVEANPGTMDKNKLIHFRNAGMNRLSIGVQSFNDDELKFMGRGHTALAAIDLINSATDLGIKVSGDFIYGLPGQTVIDIKKLCEKINEIGLTHCSMYELSIEPGTPFAKMNLQMPDNETMAQMYEIIDAALNIPRYEVSNYAAPGQECRHNQNIWDGEPYIGIGRAAAGRPLIDGVWYEQLGNDEKCDPMTEYDRAVEKVIMGLRTTRGVRLTDDVKKIIDWDFVHKNSNWFLVTGDGLLVTRKGILILDNLLLHLIR